MILVKEPIFTFVKKTFKQTKLQNLDRLAKIKSIIKTLSEIFRKAFLVLERLLTIRPHRFYLSSEDLSKEDNL